MVFSLISVFRHSWWNIPSSGLLGSVRSFDTDVSGLRISPIFKGQASWTARPLKMGPAGGPDKSLWNHLTLRNNPEDGRFRAFLHAYNLNTLHEADKQQKYNSVQFSFLGTAFWLTPAVTVATPTPLIAKLISPHSEIRFSTTEASFSCNSACYWCGLSMDCK